MFLVVVVGSLLTLTSLRIEKAFLKTVCFPIIDYVKIDWQVILNVLELYGNF